MKNDFEQRQSDFWETKVTKYYLFNKNVQILTNVCIRFLELSEFGMNSLYKR